MSGAPSTAGYTQQPPAYGYGAAPSSAAASSSSAQAPPQAQPQEETVKGSSKSWNPFGSNRSSANKGGYSAVPQTEFDEATAGAAYQDEEAGQPPKYDGPVADASPEIRAQFLKKTYSILFLQILLTTVVSAVLKTQNIGAWVQENQWAFIVPLFGSLISMGFLFFKRHSHPLNLILLTVFTLFESFSVGVIISYSDQLVVLQALIITLFTFAGLTIFTLYNADNFNFGKLGPWLFGALMFLVGAGFVQMFFPYSKTTDLVFSGAGCIVFSLYVVYDTWLITKRLSPDEWILAVVSLYLDIINLFINILRILNGTQSDN